MKKLLLFAAAALVTTGVFAQDNSRGFEYGVKAGLNLATETEVDNAKMRPGFYLGVMGEYGFGEYFSLQAELLYSQMGCRQKDDGLTMTDKRNYLVLPVLAKLYVYRGLSLDLGPQFGLQLSGKTHVKDNSGDKLTNDYMSDDDVKKFDVGFAMGLSYRITMRFDVSARYTLGFTETYKDSKNKNNVLSLGLGYRF